MSAPAAPRPRSRSRAGVALVPAAVEPRTPLPGRGPTMISTPLSPPSMPLVTEAVHALLCGFTSFVPHPHDRALGQCCGCRLWRYLPSSQGPAPTHVFRRR